MANTGDLMHRLAMILLVGGALLLQGCGFHLRGKVELSPALSNVYVDGPDLEMVTDMKDALAFNGVQIAQSAESASAVIRLNSEYERVVRTTDSRGLATGYVLRYRVRFQVVDAEGEELHKSAPIRMSRDFNFDATQVLQKEGEEEFLKEDMRKQIIQNIMRQLASIAALHGAVPVRA
jgi:LPS-assembly lipoprotein